MKLSPPSGLRDAHDTSKFYCRHECLDDWLKHRALKSEGRSARTYVVCSGPTVVGYYCIATGSTRNASTPNKIRRNAPDPIPVMIIGRLAVDKHFERGGIGSGMLKDALQRILQASSAVGSSAVLVHAIDDDARSFYEKYGFVEYPLGTKTLFLPTETIASVIDKS